MALDPQTIPFAPRGDDIWQFETDIARVQQTQAEHAERLSRLEKRQDEDARLKSVWGPSSPFPGVLSGTPQQGPIAQPLTDAFGEFDDQSQLIGSLHLDPEDEPRRIGATSRANSVRFDETANQGHWAHPSRSSIELIPRTGSSMSTHPMIERTYSHKSDGRQSSAGQSVHSVHSAASGRANSLGADTTYSATGASPLDMTTVTPGLSFLGPVPAIIRCWLTTAFRHDSLLYAAVSSGSQRSMIHEDVVHQLGYSEQVRSDPPGQRSIRLPVYLAEATVRIASSRSSSPTPQLPTLTVDFLVAPVASADPKARTPLNLAEKSVRIFLGSDVLQAHRADILFSCKTITLFDDDQAKVSIPMVRPEDEEGFKYLTISNLRFRFVETEPVLNYKQNQPKSLVLEGLQQIARVPPMLTTPNAGLAQPPSWNKPDEKDHAQEEDEAPTYGEGARQSTDERIVSTALVSKPIVTSDITSPTNRAGASSSIWGHWRRENAGRFNEQGEMARTLVGSGPRKDGIKVLRPVRSTSSDQSKQLQSRFFDDIQPRSSSDAVEKTGSLDELRESSSQAKNTVAVDIFLLKCVSVNHDTLWPVRALCVKAGAIVKPANRALQALALAPSHRSPVLCLFRQRRCLFPSPSLADVRSVVSLSLRSYIAAHPTPGCRREPIKLSPPSPRPQPITASVKKRKISKAGSGSGSEPDHGLQSNRASNLSRRHSPSIASQRSSPHPSLRTSSSPPRYIPSHLHDELRNSQGEGLGLADTLPLAASSPSEAYSRLAIHSIDPLAEQAESMSRRQSAVQPHDAPVAATNDHMRVASSLASERQDHSRSSSPAKRSAAEIETGTLSNGSGDAGVESTSAQSPRASPSRDLSKLSRTPPTTSSAYENGTQPVGGDSTDPAMHGPDVVMNGHRDHDAPPTNDEDPDRDTLDSYFRTIYGEITGAAPEEGQEGYVVSYAWLRRVIARTSFAAESQQGPFDKSVMEGRIGPIDNSAIISSIAPFDTSLTNELGGGFVPIQPGARIGEDYEIVSGSAWQQMVGLFGLAKGQSPILRYAHNTAPEGSIAEHFQYEVFPPIFTLRKLEVGEPGTSRTQTPSTTEQPRPVRIVGSRSEPYQHFLRRVKKLLDIPTITKVRLWRSLEALPMTSARTPTKAAPMVSDVISPPVSREASPKPSQDLDFLVTTNEFISMAEGTQREMIDMQDDTQSPKEDHQMLLDTLGLAADQVLIVEESITKNGEEQFLSDASRKPAVKGLVAKQNGIDSTTTSGRNSPAPSAILTRGRLRTGGRTRGTVGLQNLGNTCYMNSALQCIRAVEELAVYFLQGRWKAELNANNPLGHGGNIAKAYAGLMGSVYADGQTSAFAPRNFKNTLGRYGSQFSGYGQQDSQEFMSFLVDGLHEDLNRIHKKPYRENPESDDRTVHDPNAIRALGETYRENHRARNDSVAMDLFNGFYKNTMTCPECDKVSITFDPFSLLTLQLPVENTFQHKVTLVPLRGHPIDIDVDVDKSGTVRHLKEFVAARIPGLSADRLMLSEVYSNKFFRAFNSNKESLQEVRIGAQDDIVMYELDAVPTNWPPRRKAGGPTRSMLHIHDTDHTDQILSEEPHRDDQLLVPVFHRVAEPSRHGPGTFKLVLWPTYIVLSKAAARSEVEILRKVLGAVARTTRRNIVSDVPDSDSDADNDSVFETEEDASPTAEPSVQARSVESEDEMVDISTEMQPKTIVDEHRSTNELLFEEGSPIPRALTKLFEIKLLRSAEEVPTGWSSIDEKKQYPALRSRIPKQKDSTSPPSSAAQSPMITPAGSEDEDDQAFSHTIETIEVAGSSPEHDSFKPGSSRNVRTKHKGKRKQHTYSKKGRKFAQRNASQRQRASLSPDVETSAVDGNELLVRLGEGLVLDWDAQRFQAVFGPRQEDDSRAQVDVFSDPELEKKRAKRSERKRVGVSLEDCFTETAKGETLTEDNAWFCSRCKELRMADKKLEIWTAPDILVVHLKRFSTARNLRDKLDILVDFPIENLDLTDKVGLNEGKDLLYDLIAVDNHYGGLGGGHYTAFAKNFLDEKWYEYNDSQVSRVKNPAAVVTSAAYLLVYRRRSETPLGPPSLHSVMHDFYDPPTNSEPGSRSTSPSGLGDPKGLRLDDSFRNGSSSALVGGAGAAALLGAGSISASGTDMRMLDGGPSVYDEDEAVGLEDDEIPYGPSQPSTVAWTWGSYDNALSQHGEADGDEEMADGSNMAAGEGEGDLDARILEDFGDEAMTNPQSSPAAHPDEDLTYIGSAMSEEEAPIVEVRIEEESNGSDSGKRAD